MSGWVAGAVVASAAVGAYASSKASSAQQSAANRATDVAGQTASEQVALQREIFEKQTELQAPFREAGLAGQNRLMELLGLSVPSASSASPTSANKMLTGGTLPPGYSLQADPFKAYTQVLPRSGFQYAYGPSGDRIEVPITSGAAAPKTTARPSDFGKYATAEFGADKFKTDPGYAFRMSEGMKALERSAAARGGLMSGATLKGIQRYGQDLASTEFTNAFNRYQAERTGTLNPYQALAGTAQSGANVLGQQAGQMGSNISNALGAYGSAAQGNIIGSGNAQASGYMGGANAIAGGVGQGINFYQNQALLNRLPNYGATTGPTLLAG